MTEFTRSPLDTELTRHPLAESDPGAIRRLNLEIHEVRASGYEISIGETPDEAYDNPEEITAIYDYLYERDVILADARREVLASKIGGLGVDPRKRDYRRKKQVYAQLEPLRDELLFGETESDSRPWHQQRGRAAALLTIAMAHDLDDGTGGRYATMSGPLDEETLDLVFPETGGSLDGMSVREALLHAEVRYNGRTEERAKEVVDERLADMATFLNAPVSPQFKKIVKYCSDSLGIRSRKVEVNEVITGHVESLVASGERAMNDVLLMSYGCGTALPMLEVLQQVREDTGDAPRLILIDQDPLALASAVVLAKKMGLEDKIEIHCQRLFDGLGRPLEIDSVLQGRELDIAEDSGLREYLPDGLYKRLTRMTWKHLRKGGMMTTGNMNENRPQAEFLHGMMGWQPEVQMRPISKGLALHEQAGIPKGSTRVRVTRDGVYSLFFSQK